MMSPTAEHIHDATGTFTERTAAPPTPDARRPGTDRAAGCRRCRDHRRVPHPLAPLGWVGRPVRARRPPHAPLFHVLTPAVPHTLGPHRPPAHGEQLWRATQCWQSRNPGQCLEHPCRWANRSRWSSKKNVSLGGSLLKRKPIVSFAWLSSLPEAALGSRNAFLLKISRGSEIIYKRIRNYARRRSKAREPCLHQRQNAEGGMFGSRVHLILHRNAVRSRPSR